MSAGGGYKLDQQALQQVSKGINDTISELKELGFDSQAQLGHGFEKIQLSGMEAGHAELASSFESFCERWTWGVRALVHEANSFARRLDLSAGLYHEQEQYVSSQLKNTANAALGNPTLTAEDLKKKSWDQVLSDNPITQVRDADYDFNSQASTEAHERVLQSWDQTKKEWSTSGWAGDADHNLAMKAMGIGQDKPTNPQGGQGGQGDGGEG
ncbi:hypothetical protein [Streptomyces sp. CB02923]|uniref:hypothetical protein n=1 Tax=Streptomyces sp. CB02923 TaxID=1718985 RepID=UPI00093F2EF2|nr:hypothetical protein [Streptomyces sp. CB02923]